MNTGYLFTSLAYTTVHYLYGFFVCTLHTILVGTLYVCCYGNGVGWVILTTEFDGAASLASLCTGRDTAAMVLRLGGCANILATLENNGLIYLDWLTIFPYTELHNISAKVMTVQ